MIFSCLHTNVFCWKQTGISWATSEPTWKGNSYVFSILRTVVKVLCPNSLYTLTFSEDDHKDKWKHYNCLNSIQNSNISCDHWRVLGKQLYNVMVFLVALTFIWKGLALIVCSFITWGRWTTFRTWPLSSWTLTGKKRKWVIHICRNSLDSYKKSGGEV